MIALTFLTVPLWSAVVALNPLVGLAGGGFHLLILTLMFSGEK